jgi:hypothetical protein
MTKVINPLLSGSASGQFGQMMTFDKRGYVRKYVVPGNPKSVAQMLVRNRLGDIQRELKALGGDMRIALKASLGARWNSIIIGELLANQSAKWIADSITYNAFQSGEKSAWAAKEPAVGNTNAAGLVFFLAAKSVYDLTLRVNGTPEITEPGAATSTATEAEWVVTTP